ncbi:MAG: hypothetical protein N2511_02735 [Thermodesulfovibrionales bacterium]|nr:hypothetical protein [Thermodesulfovibrionales bacterium]
MSFQLSWNLLSEQLERSKRQQTSIQTEGDRRRVAKLSDVSYKTPLTKIKEYNLE